MRRLREKLMILTYVNTPCGGAEMTTKSPPLDLLSTSQTNARCVYGAPLVAIISGERATIGQACCNHWDCPACGVKRAKQEYRRIVAGAEALSVEHKLYFWTLTCRGKECSLEEAEENYYAWTNVLLTNARTKCKRENDFWAYVQITERQQKTRKHPHSHIITTFLPRDARGTAGKNGVKDFASAWMARANSSAGLGSQHRISEVKSAAAVSRYVAKYMFKDTLLTRWPAKWKRVRYSENWPKLPEFAPDFVAVLRSPQEWNQAGKQRRLFVCETPEWYELARHHIGNILPPS
jgi:hypothetical protein